MVVGGKNELHVRMELFLVVLRLVVADVRAACEINSPVCMFNIFLAGCRWVPPKSTVLSVHHHLLDDFLFNIFTGWMSLP